MTENMISTEDKFSPDVSLSRDDEHHFYALRVGGKIAVQSFFGVPDDRAIGAAIVLHGVSFVPVTLLGLVFMARDGISLSRAQALAAASRPV